MKALCVFALTAVGLAATGCVRSSMTFQSAERLVLPDQDADGLPDGFETEIGTDPQVADTDGDSLSDYWEVRKYGTDPLAPDTDGDGLADGDWSERTEFTRSIQAIVDLRPPFDVRHMNDFFQDARVVEKRGDDVTRVEVVLYPDAVALVNARPYAPERSEHTRPTYSKNYSAEMRHRIQERLEGCVTDVQVVSRVLWLLRETRYVELVRDLGCESDLPIHFYICRDAGGAIRESGMLGRCEPARRETIKQAVLLADSMWRLGAHGSCGSTSILRGAMLRAAGIPEKTIFTIPLLYAYEGDGTHVEVSDDFSKELLNIPPGDTSICDHVFNEVRIGNQWVRVDRKIGADGIIIWGKLPGVKIFECDDPTDYDLWKYWNYETYRVKRPYKYISVVERPATHARRDSTASE